MNNSIKYTKELNRKIYQAVARFNRTIKELATDERELLLPQKITTKEIKSSVSSKRELRTKLRELDLFKKESARTIKIESGTISKYEYDLLRSKQVRARAKIQRQLKKLEESPVYVAGEYQGFNYPSMGDDHYKNLKTKLKSTYKSLRKMTTEQLEYAKRSFDRTLASSRNEILQYNYIDMLFSTGYEYGYDSAKIVEMQDKLRGLSPNQFEKIFTQDRAIKNLLDYYYLLDNSKINLNKARTDTFNLLDSLYSKMDKIVENSKK